MPEPSLDHALSVLRALLEEHSSTHFVAQRIDMDHANLGRVLSSEYRLYLDLVARIFTALDLPLSIFHRRCLKGQRLKLGEASALLAFCRPNLGRGRSAKTASRSAFSVKLDCLLPAWLEKPPLETNAHRQEKILALEEERFATPDLVESQVEHLALEILEGPPSFGARKDLALALAIWAALSRIRGAREEARDTCQAALDCLSELEEPLCEGFLMEKAAYIAMDFDHLDSSLLLLDGALAAFVMTGEQEWQARIFTDLGIVLSLLNRLDEAEAALRTALRLLPESAIRYRFASQERLADIYQRMGRLPEAEAALEAAKLCIDSLPLASAFLAWRKGTVLIEQGKLENAVSELWSALALMRANGEALDAALVSVDLAGALLSLGRHDALKRLASDTFAWMGKLAPNKAAHRAIVKMIDLHLAGELSAAALTRVKENLEKADRRKRPASKLWA